MGLSFQIYASPTGTLLWDFSRRIQGLRFSDNEHGYAACSGFVPMDFAEAFTVYERPGLPHVKIVDESTALVWEGRLEDVEITEAGVKLDAFGYWRGYSDIPYSATHTSVTADTIVNALIAAVSAANAFMSSSTVLVQSPGVTFTDIYEDKLPSDILNRLIRLGDDQTTPRLWEAGVWEDRRLFFRPRGTIGKTWYIEVDQPRLRRTLDSLFNSGYGVYTNASGDRAVTGTNTNAASVARHALTRRAPVDASTESSALAVIAAGIFVDQHKDPPPEAELSILEVYDSAGARWPKYAVRSGDTVIARNIPPALSATIDRIRSFRVLAKEYDVDNDALNVTPEEHYPYLENIVAETKGGGSDAGDNEGASGKWNTRLKLPTKKTITPLSGSPGTGVPPGGAGAGMIGLFDSAACPTGWTEYTTARGRAIVGVPSGGTIAGTVGSALTDLSTRTINTVAQHLHAAGTLDAAAEAAHTHGVGTLNNAAEAAHTHAIDPPNTTTTNDTHDHGLFVAPTQQLLQAPSIPTTTDNNSFFDAQYINNDTHNHDVNIASFTSGAGVSHDHALSGSTAAGASHDHALSGSTANTGSASVDVTMPYIQLRLCQKD